MWFSIAEWLILAQHARDGRAWTKARDCYLAAAAILHDRHDAEREDEILAQAYLMERWARRVTAAPEQSTPHP